MIEKKMKEKKNMKWENGEEMGLKCMKVDILNDYKVQNSDQSYTILLIASICDEKISH